jgi:hypothetical protein
MPSMPINVSRPPGGDSSYTSPRHSSSSTSKSPVDDDDDELPPRVQTQKPFQPGADSSPTQAAEDAIPVHAGFDIGAIKKIVGSTNSNEVRALEQPRLDALPPLPPPTNRSESMPMPALQSFDQPPSPPVAGPSMPRFNSFEHRADSTRDADVEQPSTPRPLRPDELHQAFTAMDDEYPSTTETAPTLAFGSNNGSYWHQSSTDTSPSTQNPLSYNPFSAPSPSVPHNPFSSSSTRNPFSDPGLSFGSMDGSISSVNLQNENRATDSWSLPALRKKESRSSFSNPWS